MTKPNLKLTKNDFEEVREAHFRKCRALGHEWQHDPIQFDPTAQAAIANSLCTTCRTEKVKMILMSGAIKKPKYNYAEGYLTKPQKTADGVRIPAKKPFEWRRELVVHAINHEDIRIA